MTSSGHRRYCLLSDWSADVTCADDNGGCEHTCLGDVTGVRCACRNGYRLKDDGKHCAGQYTVFLHIALLPFSKQISLYPPGRPFPLAPSLPPYLPSSPLLPLSCPPYSDPSIDASSSFSHYRQLPLSFPPQIPHVNNSPPFAPASPSPLPLSQLVSLISQISTSVGRITADVNTNVSTLPGPTTASVNRDTPWRPTGSRA